MVGQIPLQRRNKRERLRNILNCPQSYVVDYIYTHNVGLYRLEYTYINYKLIYTLHTGAYDGDLQHLWSSPVRVEYPTSKHLRMYVYLMRWMEMEEGEEEEEIQSRLNKRVGD